MIRQRRQNFGYRKSGWILRNILKRRMKLWPPNEDDMEKRILKKRRLRKRITVLWVALLLLWLYPTMPVLAFAQNHETESMQKEQAEAFLERIDLKLEMREEKMHGLAIEAFDVSSDGKLAILTNTGVGDRCYVGVYAADGTFDYAISIFHKGSRGGEGLLWCGENITLKFSDVLFTVDACAKCVEIGQNAFSYDDAPFYEKRRQYGDDRYQMTNGSALLDRIVPNYRKIVKIDRAENQNVLYDAGVIVSVRAWLLLGLIACASAVGIWVTVVKFKEMGEREKRTRQTGE